MDPFIDTQKTHELPTMVSQNIFFNEPVFAGERNLNFYKFSQDLEGGTYYWQVKSKNDCGESASDIRKFKLNLNDLGSIFKWQIAVEPNPVDDRVNIHISEKLQDVTISIYSIEGRLMFSQLYLEELNHFSVNTTHFPSGMYIVRVLYKQGSFSKRVVKQDY